MTGNKSYKEIVATCKLLDYVDTDEITTETWFDDNYGYICYWFPQNKGELPNTIKQTCHI